MPGACVRHAYVLYFPVTCNLSRAVTLPNIGVLHYIEVPHWVAYPYSHDRYQRLRLQGEGRCLRFLVEGLSVRAWDRGLGL